MSQPNPARYRTTNWSSHNDALRKRESLIIWLDKEMAWHAPHQVLRGRPPVISDAAIQFCLSVKMLFKLPLRQTAGMVASLLRLAGLDWPVPNYSALCRRQKTLKVQIQYRRSGEPLNLLINRTGQLPARATKPCAPRANMARRSGSGGPDTTPVAASRPRCGASSPSASAPPK